MCSQAERAGEDAPGERTFLEATGDPETVGAGMSQGREHPARLAASVVKSSFT